MVRNGSFEDPVPGTWIEYAGAGDAAVFERTSATAHDGSYSEHVSVRTAGLFSGAALIQTGIPVVQGTTYEFQFWAKSSSARDTQTALIMDGGDFHSYGLSTKFALGTSWQLCKATFQATESNPDARLEMYFGDQSGDVWIDSVSLLAVAAATSP
jgi:hypothetical protein